MYVLKSICERGFMILGFCCLWGEVEDESFFDFLSGKEKAKLICIYVCTFCLWQLGFLLIAVMFDLVCVDGR